MRSRMCVPVSNVMEALGVTSVDLMLFLRSIGVVSHPRAPISAPGPSCLFHSDFRPLDSGEQLTSGFGLQPFPLSVTIEMCKHAIREDQGLA